MSQFLVMPTLFESVSIPIYEAFALEVAVCSSNVVALPEQVGDAGLIFDPNDIHDMASSMIKYLEDDNLPKELSLIDDELKAIYHSKETICFFIFKTRKDRNEFIERSKGMKKIQREQLYNEYK